MVNTNDMGRMEEYLRTKDADAYTTPTPEPEEVDAPFVDTSDHVESRKHFRENAWTVGEAYIIKTTIMTIEEWTKSNRRFVARNARGKLIKSGLCAFFIGLSNDDTVASFLYMDKYESKELKIPIEIYLRGTVDIHCVM